jgi:sulfotransferase family protein
MTRLVHLYKLLDPDIRAKNLRAVRYASRGRYWTLMRPEAPDPIFIVGCSRSGTTVTYETIAAAPGLLSFGWEIPEFWESLYGPHACGWASHAAAASDARPEHRTAAQRHFFERLGRGQVLDKTCINVLRVEYLYALFPNARFIYLHRDGRDNVSSLIEGWRHDGHFGLTKLLGPFPCAVAINGGEFADWSFFLPPGWRAYNDATLEDVCAFQWITANRMALDAGRLVPPAQWLSLRYEDVFDRPVEMFRRVFEWLELPFDDAAHARCAALASTPTSIVRGAPKRQKWKEHNPEAIRRILPKIRALQLELGYDADV